MANYAPLTVGGVLLVVMLWWQLSARKWFKGPVREGTDEEILTWIRSQAGPVSKRTLQAEWKVGNTRVLRLLKAA